MGQTRNLSQKDGGAVKGLKAVVRMGMTTEMERAEEALAEIEKILEER